MRSKSATFKSMLQRRAQQTLLRPLARHGSSATFFGEYDMLPHTALVNAESKCIHAMRPYLNHAFRNDQLFITGKTNFYHLEKQGGNAKQIDFPCQSHKRLIFWRTNLRRNSLQNKGKASKCSTALPKQWSANRTKPKIRSTQNLRMGRQMGRRLSCLGFGLLAPRRNVFIFLKLL